MKLKELQGILQDVKAFEKPNVKLEQYPTSPHIAAHMMYTIENSFEDLDGKSVLDLGTGTGMLGIGAQILGSSYTLGVDIDENALSIAQENCEEMEIETMEFMLSDIQKLKFTKLTKFDTVVMNPPFGTKIKGIDMIFLKKGVELSNNAVYSLHKTSTREHIFKKAKEWGCEIEVVAELRWDIPKMYKFHKQSSVDIDVDLLRLEVPQNDDNK